MPYVRKLLVSLLLSGIVASVVPGEASAMGKNGPSSAEIVPAQAYAPLSAVAVMLGTSQALLFDETANKYRTVTVGEVVAGWKVVAIHARKVVVLRDGEIDVLTLVAPPKPIEGAALTRAQRLPALEITPDAASAPKNMPPLAPEEDTTTPRKIARADLTRELGDFDRLSTAVDVVIAENGGFRLSRVEKGSWPWRMGLRAGDVIRSAAGERVATIDDAARVYARLRASKAFTLEIDRPMRGIVDVPDPPTTRIVLQFYVK
jgi:hypothetical protein